MTLKGLFQCKLFYDYLQWLLYRKTKTKQNHLNRTESQSTKSKNSASFKTKRNQNWTRWTEQCWRVNRALRTCFWCTESLHFSFPEWAVGSQGWSCHGPGGTKFVGREGFGQNAPPAWVLCWCGSASFNMVSPGKKSPSLSLSSHIFLCYILLCVFT